MLLGSHHRYQVVCLFSEYQFAIALVDQKMCQLQHMPLLKGLGLGFGKRDQESWLYYPIKIDPYRLQAGE